MGELGERDSMVRMGGNGGRALGDTRWTGLTIPEDGASELVRIACGCICSAGSYMYSNCMAGLSFQARGDRE